MQSKNSSDTKRLLTGISIGIVLLILATVACAAAILMVSVMVMGCTKSLPEWLYMIVFVGFPLPLIITSIVVPYLYIKRQQVVWIILTPIAGIILSCLIFLIWFIILTQYC